MSIYIHKNNLQTGPFEEAKVLEWLAAGQLSRDDMAFRQGEQNWRPLKELFPSMADSSPATPPNIPNAPVSFQPANNSVQKKSGGSKAFIFILVGLLVMIFGGVMAVAAFFIIKKPYQTPVSTTLANKNSNTNLTSSNTNSANSNSSVSNQKELNDKLKEFAKLKPPAKIEKSPIIKGKVIVVEQRDRSNEYSLKMLTSYDLTKYGLTQDKMAQNLSEIDTLVQISCGKGSVIGKYGPRMAYVPAYSNVCNVSIIDYKAMKTIAQKTFVNGKKPVTINVTASEYEYILPAPTDEIEKYLSGIPKE